MKIELQGHYGYRRLVKTMLPSVAMMIVTSVYSIVDGFFVSNFAGSTAFAQTLIFELGCVFILPYIFGVEGIWWSVNVAEVCALILATALVLGFGKRYGYLGGKKPIA